MQLPALLSPITSEAISLSDGRVIAVPKTTPLFSAWAGDVPFDTFGGKAVLSHAGEPCFAEVVILRLFLEAGWSGRWVETYGAANMGPRMLSTWQPGSLKQQVLSPIADNIIQQRLDSIACANRSTYSGCWDVVAWQGDELVFVESKRKKHDRFRPTQVRWLEAALASGLGPHSFLVVEWSVEQGAAA